MYIGCCRRLLVAIVAIALVSPLVHAHPLSDFQCTANDVRIIGTGQVINEPCDCTGTFTATVQFTVENNAGSPRNCITLHLCPIALPGGGTFNPGDIILQGEIAGKTTQTMTGTIENYPCGAGRLCFGDEVLNGRGRCDAGTCCSTVTWGVPGQDTCPSDRFISSKCRHQQICIQSRPSPTLECTNGDCNSCGGGSLTLCSKTSGTFELLDASGAVVRTQIVTSPVGGLYCATFANLDAGTYTGNFTGADNCERTSSAATLTPQSTLTAPVVTLASSCSPTGSGTLSALSSGSDTITYTWSGVTCTGGETSNPCTFTPTSVSTTCQTVATVVASADGCDATTTFGIQQCITSQLCTPP